MHSIAGKNCETVGFTHTLRYVRCAAMRWNTCTHAALPAHRSTAYVWRELNLVWSQAADLALRKTQQEAQLFQRNRATLRDIVLPQSWPAARYISHREYQSRFAVYCRVSRVHSYCWDCTVDNCRPSVTDISGEQCHLTTLKTNVIIVS